MEEVRFEGALKDIKNWDKQRRQDGVNQRVVSQRLCTNADMHNIQI